MSKKRKIFLFVLLSLILILLFFFFFSFKEKIIQIIMPFFLAMILAYLLNPIVIRLERRNISRMTGIFIIYFISTITITLLVMFMIPEIISNIKDLMNTLPDMTKSYQKLFNNFMSFIKTSNWPADVKDSLFNEIGKFTKTSQIFIMNTLKELLASLVDTFLLFLDIILAMILAYYFIKDSEFFKNMILSLTPRKWRNGIIKTGREIHSILSNFIKGQLITAFIVGVMVMIGLSIIKIKYALILGIIGGIANVIPYFGPIIGAIPAIALALIESPAKAIETAVVFTIIQQIDNAFISPKIIEGKLGLHPVSTILAVLIGGEFFGVPGMLVAVPAMAILKVILKNITEAIV